MSKIKKSIPKSAITEKQLKKLLKQKAKKFDSISEWAKSHGITPQAVSAFMRNVQGAGLQIPEVLGYRPQVIFLPLKEDLISHANPPRRVTDRPSKKVDHSRKPVEKRSLNLRDRMKKAKG